MQPSTSIRRERLDPLMARLADGDRGAFDELFGLAWPAVRAFCARLLAGDPDAEDAAQAALLKVFERAAQYRRGEDARAWIMTIAYFECRTLRQKRRRRREVGEGSETVGAVAPSDAGAFGASPETVLLRDELSAAIESSLAGLSPLDRETIIASIFEHDRGGVAAATFRKRLERAMGRFKDRWRADHGS